MTESSRDSRLSPQTAFYPAMESEFTDLLCAAKCKARPDYKPVRKNAKGNFGAYATLDEVLDAVTPALAANGLDLSAKTVVLGDQQMLISTLRHTSGQFERAMSLITERVPQKILAETTYFRRNHAACLAGVAADSDLDGAGLEGPKAKKPAAAGLARSALLGARTEKDRDTVLAKAAMSVVAGRMTEDEMVELKECRESLKPFAEVANAGG